MSYNYTFKRQQFVAYWYEGDSLRVRRLRGTMENVKDLASAFSQQVGAACLVKLAGRSLVLGRPDGRADWVLN